MRPISEVNGGTTKGDPGSGNQTRERNKETARIRDPLSESIIWAEVVNDVEADTLQRLISQKVSPGSVVCSDTWKAYTGIA